MSDSPIILISVVEAVAGRERELAVMLSKLVGPTRSETGCLFYELNASQENAGTFVFYEKFASQSDLDKHLNSQHFQEFLKERETSDPVAKTTITRWTALA